MATISQRPAASYRAYQVLHVLFVLVPIVLGADKLFNRLANWGQYLAPDVTRLFPGNIVLTTVAVVEIIAGVVVLFRPSVGAWIVMLVQLALAMNFLMMPETYYLGILNVSLAVGALALGLMAFDYERISKEASSKADAPSEVPSSVAQPVT